MYRLDVFNRTRCQPPNCKSLVKSNVTSAAHKGLARDISAESIVLLKNTDNILPITLAQGSKLAIVGSPADAKPYNPIGGTWNRGDYYSGGGSGHVTVPSDTVTPLEAIAMRARQAGITVTNDTSDNATSSAALAQEADLTLIFAGTTSGEAQDRANLKLDHHADDLISAVIMACRSTTPKKKIAVLMMIPGAVTMPWHADADLHAIAAQFLGGEEAAGSWVDVLFGDKAPAGRLPVMMPETEADSIAPLDGPKPSYPVVYTEGMGTSYRNTAFNASFPFGHGLTYTSFKYDSAEKSSCNEGEQSSYCVSVQITNDGVVAAKAVPQLYLQFPDSAGLIQGRYGLLKGFQKTELIQPSHSTQVKFVLTSDQFSYYSEAEGGFVQATSAVAHIGESSADIRQDVTFEQVQLHEIINSEHLVVV
jgi:beta-glucosidase